MERRRAKRCDEVVATRKNGSVDRITEGRDLPGANATGGCAPSRILIYSTEITQKAYS